MHEPDRREFLSTAGRGALAVAAANLASSAIADTGSQRVKVGVIGTGGMGGNHVKLLAGQQDVDLAYVCDVDAERRAAAAGDVEQQTGRRPKEVNDLRQVLDDNTVDAVWIATPDHWHAPAAILACRAGKHVYVEKPCCHNIREGRLLVEAARRHNRVVQVGTQSRSTHHVLDAIARLQAGAIGEILVAKVWNSQRRGNIGHAEPADPPSYLDYDLWIGPAPMVAYRKTLLPGIWRWWYAFGAGDIGNDGIHDLDLAWWGLGVDTHPTRIAALGGKQFFDDDQQFPDTQSVVFEYAGKDKRRTKQLLFEQRLWSPYTQETFENGAAFYGTDGYLVLGHQSGYRLYGPRDRLIEEKTGGSADLLAHHRNFLECVRSGGLPNADIEVGHRSAALCHLGNIATRVGRVLHFDPQAERIADDPQADALLHREYRQGHWAVPEGV